MTGQKLQLFGGSIEATAPAGLIDASDLRQIPDNQEVFLIPDSEISIIVEILESVAPKEPRDIATFHFDSLAQDNLAISSSVKEFVVVPNGRGDPTPSAFVLAGVQMVSKFNLVKADEVRILMAVFRVQEKNVDVVVTFNIPTTPKDKNGGNVDGLDLPRMQFETFVKSLSIVNFGLFA